MFRVENPDLGGAGLEKCVQPQFWVTRLSLLQNGLSEVSDMGQNVLS